MKLFGYDVDVPFFEEQMTPEMAAGILAQPTHERSWQGYSQVAGALNVVGKHPEAEWLMRKAVNCERNVVTLMNLAFIMHTLGKYREAFPIVEEAYALDPLNKWTAVLYGESLIRMGDWDEGWEVREKFYWDTHWGKFARFPIWNGQDLKGKRIAVPNFEGYGDCIMYFAWVRLLKELGARVVFYCDENIAPLFEGHSWLHEVRPIVNKQVYFGMEHFDYFLPLVALPNHFETDPKPIPWWGPYLTAYPKFRHHREGKPVIGLCSRAGELTAQFSTRALSDEQKNRLLGIKGIEWINLDFGDQPLIKDWSDTAAALDILDIVITVDTGVAHLAGAMGKAVWVLVNGGLTAAWYGIDRTTSPFYPSMRLFRNQGPGLENSVAAVAEALQSPE